MPALDGLRAISILLVLAAHLLPLGPKSLRLNEAAGAMGMSLFFALSGFLIVTALRHNADAVEFVVRRLARILPLAYLYLLIVSVFIQFDPATVFATAAFLINYDFAHLTANNAHFWSLCVEVHFYAVMAVGALMVGRRAIWLVWPACIFFTGLRVLDGAYISIETHLRVDEILAGACVATLYRPAWSGAARGLSVPTVVAAALAWFACAWPYAGALQYLRPYATAFGLAAVLCNASAGLDGMLTASPMRYIASISYALYVLHPLTAFGWWNEGTVIERYLLKRPLTFLITFVAAHVSTFHWERRWIEAAGNWIARRRAERDASTAAADAPCRRVA